MKEFSVCYDRFCLGNYTLVCDGSDTVQATADLGAFEMYVLGMWNDGLVVTMKAYDEVCGENQFVLLVPDGSEQLMSFSPGRGFVVRPYRAARQGRFAYLLDFLCGLKYKGYQGYEEYDEEEKMRLWTRGCWNRVLFVSWCSMDGECMCWGLLLGFA